MDREAWARKMGEILEETGCSKAGFAALCGVSEPTVGNWCKGVRPQKREGFIRIGFAAGYDLEGVNALLQDYGEYPALYAKVPEDCVYIYALRSGKPAAERWKFCKEQIAMLPVREPCFGTGYVDHMLESVEDEEQLMRFIEQNSAVNRTAYQNFYGYLDEFLRKNLRMVRWEDEGEEAQGKKPVKRAKKSLNEEEAKAEKDKKDSFWTRFADQHHWCSSLWTFMSGVNQRKWPNMEGPLRWKLMALGIRLNMNEDQLDKLLLLGRMSELRTWVPLEAAVIQAVRDAEDLDLIHPGPGDDFSRFVCHALGEQSIPEAGEFLRYVRIPETALLLDPESGEVEIRDLTLRDEWTIRWNSQRGRLEFRDAPGQKTETARFSLRREEELDEVVPEVRWMFSGNGEETELEEGGRIVIRDASGKTLGVLLYEPLSADLKWDWFSLGRRKAATVGSDQGRCQLIHTGRKIASQQFRIEEKEGRHWVSDCGSRTVTRLNSAPLREPAALNPGDRLSVEKSYFIYAGEGLLYTRK